MTCSVLSPKTCPTIFSPSAVSTLEMSIAPAVPVAAPAAAVALAAAACWAWAAIALANAAAFAGSDVAFACIPCTSAGIAFFVAAAAVASSTPSAWAIWSIGSWLTMSSRLAMRGPLPS